MAIYGPNAKPTPEMEQTFFTGVVLPNGTFKTTADRRLDDLNEAILAHLPEQRPLRVKDVAVSSGISSLEWYEVLHAHGIAFQMMATDLWLRARLIEARGFNVLLSETGSVLQLDIVGLRFQPSHAPKKRMAFAPILACIRSPRVLTRLARSERPVLLVSPRLLGSPVSIVEEDLLKPQPGEWDVIRAANIINHEYFPTPILRQMLLTLAESLAPGGILAVCRTEPSVGNRTSIFRLDEGTLSIVAELNGGSDVAYLAAGVVPETVVHPGLLGG